MTRSVASTGRHRNRRGLDVHGLDYTSAAKNAGAARHVSELRRYSYQCGWNQMKATVTKTTVSMAAAPKNAIRMERVGANKTQRKKTIAKSGASRIRSGDSIDHAPRKAPMAAFSDARKSTKTATPVVVIARAPATKMRQNHGYGRRKNNAAPVAGMAVTVKTLRKRMLSPKAAMPLEACLSGPLVAAA
jgi:hypothetical protein